MAVLMVTLIVSAVGFSAMSIARQMLSNTVNSNDAYEARLLAQAGIEYAATRWYWNPSWRTTFNNNVEYPVTPYEYGNGTFTYKFVDEDGNLADDATDAVWVYGIGRVGDAVQVQKVLMLPAGDAVTSMEAAFHCNGNVNIGSALLTSIDLTTNQMVSSNGNISVYNLVSSNDLNGDAEAVGTISGSVTGSETTGISPRIMPSDAALEYYKINGTRIDISDLPVDGFGTPEISRLVLSPASNPFGTETNPEGIYVIDCEGQNLEITQSRIAGTIVAYNVETVTVSGNVNWNPVVGNYPATLVEGTLELQTNQSTLREADELANFNPVGTPYEGAEDSDQTDEYPSEINGLIYTTGQLTIGSLSNPKATGTVISNSFDLNSDWTVDYESSAFDNPPPGFGDGSEMRICPGSWQRASASE